MPETGVQVIARFGSILNSILLAFGIILFLAIGLDVIFYQVYGYPKIVGFLLHEYPFRRERFTQDRWLEESKNPDYDTSCFRGGMVRSLTQFHLHVGKSNREDVENLLGYAGYKVSIGGTMCSAYPLGWCSGFRLDPDSLFICYDNHDVVSQSGHIQH